MPPPTTRSEPRLPVPMLDLTRQHAPLAGEIRGAIDRVLAGGAFVGGPEVAAFEAELAAWHGVPHCLGVANGTDAVAIALRALYGVETGLRLDRIRETAARIQELSGYGLAPWKPLTGETLFRRESGAVASQFHDPPSIEPYSSELVGAERAIVLGKKSGLDSIRIKAEELGIDVPEEQRAEVLAKVKELGTRKRGLVTDDEFRELAGG